MAGELVRVRGYQTHLSEGVMDVDVLAHPENPNFGRVVQAVDIVNAVQTYFRLWLRPAAGRRLMKRERRAALDGLNRIDYDSGKLAELEPEIYALLVRRGVIHADAEKQRRAGKRKATGRRARPKATHSR